jgi:hypothetical protein
MDETRRAYISELENRFKPFTDALNQELQDWRFNFAEQKISASAASTSSSESCGKSLMSWPMSKKTFVEV